MSLTYGTLKTQILSDTHRPELTNKVADFVRSAEGVIARRLRCAEMITRIDITDADRVTAAEGFFTLPADYLEERSYFLNGQNGIRLEKTSLAELRTISGSAPIRYYSTISKTEVEFRGVPSDTTTIELIYFARPATFVDDADVNAILTNHEDIYLQSSIAALYAFTQDRELANDASAAAANEIEALNEQAGRLLGGSRQRGFYNLSSYGGR